MKQVIYSVLVGLSVVLSSGCSVKATDPLDLSPAGGGTPDNKTQTPATPALAIDLNGKWTGEGTVHPAELWSVGQAHASFPSDYATRCVVNLGVHQANDSIELTDLHVQMPDLQSFGWFDAHIVDHVTQTDSGSGAVVTISFDPMKFKIIQKPDSPSGTQDLFPVRRDGTVFAQPWPGASLVSSQQLVIPNFPIPYAGAYQDGSGSTYTASVSLSLTLTGKDVYQGEVSFSSYGSSASGTDAKCSGFTLGKAASRL